jgi:hypothetical protein
MMTASSLRKTSISLPEPANRYGRQVEPTRFASLPRLTAAGLTDSSNPYKPEGVSNEQNGDH